MRVLGNVSLPPQLTEHIAPRSLTKRVTVYRSGRRHLFFRQLYTLLINVPRAEASSLYPVARVTLLRYSSDSYILTQFFRAIYHN